jgi:outer membrane protein OmpA-like peptidoglycan-associated protein
MKLSLIGHDSDGFFSPTLSLYPWSLAIPHDDVMFDTASSHLLPPEMPKLKVALLAMNKRIAQYKEIIPVKLFVLGHTDSVGEKSKNKKLSKQRAAAIAKWFVAQGVTVPVFARGFGESDLRVSTGDEVDEPINRRVDYILAVEPPSHRSWQGWKTIQGLKPTAGQE